jgi:hypothetical protein
MKIPDKSYEVVEITPDERLLAPIAETGCRMPCYT